MANVFGADTGLFLHWYYLRIKANDITLKCLKEIAATDHVCATVYFYSNWIYHYTPYPQPTQLHSYPVYYVYKWNTRIILNIIALSPTTSMFYDRLPPIESSGTSRDEYPASSFESCDVFNFSDPFLVRNEKFASCHTPWKHTAG